MDKRTITASDVFGKERSLSLSLSRARERPKNQRKDNRISTTHKCLCVCTQNKFVPRAARRVSTADRIADVNTPTRCSDSSRAMSFSPPTRSLVLVSMSSSSSLPVARSFFSFCLSPHSGIFRTVLCASSPKKKKTKKKTKKKKKRDDARKDVHLDLSTIGLLLLLLVVGRPFWNASSSSRLRLLLLLQGLLSSFRVSKCGRF
jgi:hypothetical protein